ncbi:lysylphosphatidylglycerol synthase transmembrane domain-containing protein [Flavobacterium selenitireducens]|uniref:lysylphosphatidylglycerol synthase transmembrane domain-containing protein n=1 Tax=Flavobacterium selenitireducens TaxID=2722704 RepID=UPI00168B9C9D|nr:lysylphosphatidylglycerol synthase transmembrane domain-containing protein [Flavobacterium selenitireducens]MBD3581795.1 flippase-like domain-containing protein [Flavobacterium selenitireducens]
MKQPISKFLSIVLPIALGIYLIVYTYNGFTPEQIDEIRSYFRDAEYSYIVIGALIAVLGNVSRAWRWKYPLEQMGYKSSFLNNFLAINICYLLNLAVPKSGEVSRAVILKKYEDIPFDKGFGSIVAERLLDVLILFGFMLLAFFLQFDVVKAFVLDQIPLNKLLLFGGIGFGIGMIFLWIYMYSKSKYVLLLKEKISGLKEGVFSILKMEKKWLFLAHTMLIWASYLLTFYVTMHVFPQTSGLSFGAAISAFVVGSIAIAFTNSGFGSYPFLISQILVFYAVEKTVGNAFGWIVWTSQMLVVVIFGFASFILLPILNRGSRTS